MHEARRGVRLRRGSGVLGAGVRVGCVLCLGCRARWAGGGGSGVEWVCAYGVLFCIVVLVHGSLEAPFVLLLVVCVCVVFLFFFLVLCMIHALSSMMMEFFLFLYAIDICTSFIFLLDVLWKPLPLLHLFDSNSRWKTGVPSGAHLRRAGGVLPVPLRGRVRRAAAEHLPWKAAVFGRAALRLGAGAVG